MFLDVAKGVAIILVVVGHICQGARTDFDHFFPFRLIYSFHMPMFICLAGMVASLKIESFFPVCPTGTVVSNVKNEVWGATQRLLIPFIAWTIAYYFLGHNDGTLTYFKNVIASPDWSLWFLLALFYCRMLLEAIREIVILSRIALNRIFKRDVAMLDNPVFALAIIVFGFLIFHTHGPNAVGFGFLRSYFPYYLFGIFLYKYKDKIRHRTLIQSICLIVFCLLMPFWYRTEPGPAEAWLSQFMSPGKASMLFRYTVAICGTMTFLLAVKLLVRRRIAWVNIALAFSGSLTLGVYALHGQFMWIPPIFFGTFAASLLATWLIRKIPVIRFFLLGERPFR